MNGLLAPLVAVLGGVLMLFSLTMAVPLAFAVFDGEAGLLGFDLAMVFTFACGLVAWLAGRHARRELQPRDGILLVVGVWTVLPAFGAVPLLINIPGLSFTDAYFEAASALTTTCATVLSGLDHLPLAVNVWRCFMVLLGGLGILVLAVAILPLLGVGGSQLFKSETPGPMKDAKLTPRIAETARALWTVYISLWLLCLLAYRAAGKSWSDAFMHASTTISLGGFAAYDASLGHYDSVAVEAVAIVFMIAGGLSFAQYFRCWQRRSLRPLASDSEARAYLAILAVAVLGIAAFLHAHAVYPSFAESLRHAAINVVSMATTSGFATEDWAQWPIFAPMLMLFLTGFCTCAGSTGGGVKLMRALLLLQLARNELTRIVHPRAVLPVTLNGGIVEARVLQAVLAFMLVYGAVMAFATLALLATGLDVVSAFTAVVACINNAGPGLGEVGPAGNYQGLTDLQTWICTVTMLLGRLELLAVLVLFTPAFWRR